MNINFENHGGNIEKEARKLGLSTENIIDASASIVPVSYTHLTLPTTTPV